MKKLGEEIRAVRNLRQLSLAAVAEPAKISAAYLQKLEAGTVKNPSPRVLQRLAVVLDLSYERLMELAGYLPPGPGSVPSAGGGLLEQALGGEELTEEEQRAVIAFITYLKSQRRKG